MEGDFRTMKIKTALELGLTLAIVAGIFAFVTNNNVMEDVQTKIVDQQMVSSTGVSATEALGTGEDGAFKDAAGEKNVAKLSAMAKGEANKMLRSGDTSAYQKEMENNPLLKKIIRE